MADQSAINFCADCPRSFGAYAGSKLPLQSGKSGFNKLSSVINSQIKLLNRLHSQAHVPKAGLAPVPYRNMGFNPKIFAKLMNPSCVISLVCDKDFCACIAQKSFDIFDVMRRQNFNPCSAKFLLFCVECNA